MLSHIWMETMSRLSKQAGTVFSQIWGKAQTNSMVETAVMAPMAEKEMMIFAEAAM